MSDEDACGLSHAFDDERHGHDGELWAGGCGGEVVVEVVFGHGEVFDGDDFLLWLKFDDSVDPHPSHGCFLGLKMTGWKPAPPGEWFRRLGVFVGRS